MLIFFAILISAIGVNCEPNTYLLCAPETIDDTTCNSLHRKGGLVTCVRVTDSAECAIKLFEGKADFAVLDGEELLLAYQFYPNEFTPLAQLRQTDRLNEDWRFQSVVVVPSNYNANEGVPGVKNGGLCHPGFSHTQMWNDYILKFFERKAYDHKCRPELTVAENEAENIKNFFSKACRPGPWVLEPAEDKRLKELYPELCQLCDDQKNCQYDNKLHHGHMGALECLTSGRGNAAYVAYEHVIQYFNINGSNPSPILANASAVQPGFQFLCPQGTLQPLTQSNPCAWIREPWGAVLARNDIASPLLEDMKRWLPADARTPSEAWLAALNKILEEDSKSIYFSEPISLRNYLVNGREVDLPSLSCGSEIRWCTLSPAETTKCQWVSKEAALLGLEPRFSCTEKNSTVDCLQSIHNNKSDIITVDSNHGHLARQKYNLTSILYPETLEDRNSRVIAVVRENNDMKVKSFKEIRGKYLCFPEYGGISWLSFINVARQHGIISDTCDYAGAVAKLVTAGCTPGIKDSNYSDVVDGNPEILDTLCSICPSEFGNQSCSARRTNEYFGDRGVLNCLEGSGEIGFIEPRNLQKSINQKKMIDQHAYRVLCKNGSLASYTGFSVDDNCALSVTIDSEVVGRRENPRIQTIDTTLALLKIEDWLGYRSDSRRAIRIYDSFTDHSDLLFKDSTIGLEAADSTIKSVLAYKEIFEKIETCRSNTSKIIINTINLLLSMSITLLLTM